MTTDISAVQFTTSLVQAVRDQDRDAFLEHVQCGIAYFDDKQLITDILSRQLPLLLEVDQQTTLLRFMTGDEDYRSTVQSLLAEMVQVLLSVGQTGFRYLEQEATPTLLLTEETFAWLQSDYQPAPFRQCLPYLQVQV